MIHSGKNVMKTRDTGFEIKCSIANYYLEGPNEDRQLRQGMSLFYYSGKAPCGVSSVNPVVVMYDKTCKFNDK
jgi:hypothetical protein